MDKFALVWSGGSSKIPLHMGAFKAIVDKGVEFDSVYGTSAGSIVAAMIAKGLSYTEMEDLAVSTEFTSFVKNSVRGYLKGLFFRNGIVDGCKLLEFLYKVLGKETKFSDLPYSLNIVAHSLVTRSWVLFNKEETPNVPVALAVRASCSIPVLFSPVCMRVERKNRASYDWFVDGGLSKDFAVDIVPPDKPFIGHLIQNSNNYIWDCVDVKTMSVVSLEQIVQANCEESIRDSKLGVDRIVVRTTYDKSMANFYVSLLEKREMLKIGYNNMTQSLGKLNI